jgi:hypothetical protein
MAADQSKVFLSFAVESFGGFEDKLLNMEALEGAQLELMRTKDCIIARLVGLPPSFFSHL